MARFTFTILLLMQTLTIQVITGNSEDESPLLDMASAFLQNMADGGGAGTGDGMAAIGNIVGSLMQGDNAKNLGSILGQNGGDAGDVISGIGSLLGGQGGGIDPNIVGSMISMFASQMANNQPNESNGPQSGDGTAKREKRENPELNLDGILGMASSILTKKNVRKFLPMVMNTINSFSGNEVERRAHDHEDHASFLPPFLEKIHLYWDLFINSDLGKALWYKSGLPQVMKAFTGPDGKISFERMMNNFENRAFRRHWIKTAATYLTDTVMHISKPDVYKTYLVSGQYIINGFLDSQGIPRSAHLSLKNPEASVTSLMNYVLKKYLDITTDVSTYVKPALEYSKQVLTMAQSASHTLENRSEYNALTDHLTDTLNLEVIEPVLRVYRAYKHSVDKPHCQEHLMCLVNRHSDEEKAGGGFKPGLTKISSMVASAALSFQNGKGFWDLYNAIQNDVNCEAKYPADCSTFHEHELKVTTEVYHSEL